MADLLELLISVKADVGAASDELKKLNESLKKNATDTAKAVNATAEQMAAKQKEADEKRIRVCRKNICHRNPSLGDTRLFNFYNNQGFWLIKLIN